MQKTITEETWGKNFRRFFLEMIRSIELFTHCNRHGTWSVQGVVHKLHFLKLVGDLTEHNYCYFQPPFLIFIKVSKFQNEFIKSQFYIQLLYRPHLRTWILPFGLLGSKRKISKTTEFLLKYATFWGGFFMFSRAKIKFFDFFFTL